MASARDEVVDVLIVGGGWSGLLTCKYAKEEKLSVIVLEKRSNLGGVWRYSDDTDVTTVMKNTRTSSSSTLTEISDYPMPDKIGEFPKHEDILKYLEAFAEQFDLLRHVRFNCSVKNTMKQGNMWQVTTDDNDVYFARNLSVCSGVHQEPNMDLKTTLLSNYTGEILHAGKLKQFGTRHSGKRVLILGGGETASDVVSEYSSHVEKCIWCIPNGQHFFRKYAKILPHKKPQALDKASSRALKLICPPEKSKPGLAWVCRWTTNGSLIAYQGHGIPEWRNDVPFFHSFINKQAHALDFVDYSQVIPKGPIERVEDKTIHFQDGSTYEIDVIILCTGYNVRFPFLPADHREADLTDHYKYVFDVNDPSLSYIGYVRPILGSIPTISEMQARWVCRVISGRVKLPVQVEMVKGALHHKMFWEQYFDGTSKRIGTLVEGLAYVDDVAKLCGCYPNYWELFKASPKDWFRAYFAPYNACSYLLNEPDKKEDALKTLKKHSADTTNPIHLLLILLMRFLLFDWFLDILGGVKYHVQKNSIWKRVRDNKVIKAVDYVWTAPKRYAFDNHTKLS